MDLKIILAIAFAVSSLFFIGSWFIVRRLDNRLLNLESQVKDFDAVMEIIGRYASFYGELVEIIKVMQRFELPTDVKEKLQEYIAVTEKFGNLLDEVNKK